MCSKYIPSDSTLTLVGMQKVEESVADIDGRCRNVKKHTKHGKKKGQNQPKHYENEKHSLQGKSGKVCPYPYLPLSLS